jgi:hypothetical protein
MSTAMATIVENVFFEVEQLVLMPQRKKMAIKSWKPCNQLEVFLR